ncbi:MAG: hypothetical protein IJW06_02400 [Clostridia bacterium]|nr:hypothetical protein [Clostridia bacterium]
MAMIKCPECEKMVSNMASSCPNCGYPIAKSASDGVVQVKLGMFQSTQGASIVSGGKTLWSGRTGQVAELKLERATNVQIKYQMGMFDAPGSCEGVIDPKKSKKWQVVSRPGLITMKLTLQPVDIFDAN